MHNWYDASFSYYELNITPTPFKTKTFNIKTLILFTIVFFQTLHSYYNFIQVKMFLKVTYTHLYIIQKKTNQEIF